MVALPGTGNSRSGAALVLAVTLAQVVGAVPVAGLGRDRNAVFFLKILVIVRTIAFAAVAVLAGSHAPYNLLIAGAALAGLVNGAAFGFQRSVLNHLVEPSRMSRALSLATMLGTLHPVLTLLFPTALGATTAAGVGADAHG